MKYSSSSSVFAHLIRAAFPLKSESQRSRGEFIGLGGTVGLLPQGGGGGGGGAGFHSVIGEDEE